MLYKEIYIFQLEFQCNKTYSLLILIQPLFSLALNELSTIMIVIHMFVL